jgi:hypothetical protein
MERSNSSPSPAKQGQQFGKLVYGHALLISRWRAASHSAPQSRKGCRGTLGYCFIVSSLEDLGVSCNSDYRQSAATLFSGLAKSL